MLHHLKLFIRCSMRAILGIVGVASLAQLAQAAEGDIKINIGWIPAEETLFYIAREEGLFEKRGLEPEYIRFNAGPPMLAALRTGDLDIAYMATPPFIAAVSQDLPVKVFFTEVDTSIAERLIVQADGGYKSLKDLKGKQVAVWRGTSAEMALRKAMEQAGMGETDLQILDVDATNVIPAFRQKQVDGVWIWDPWALRLEKMGGQTLLTDKQAGVQIPGLWLGNANWLEDPEGAKRFLLAMEDARKILLKDKNLAAELTGKTLEVDTTEAMALIDRLPRPTLEDQVDPNNPFSLAPEAIASGQGLVARLVETAEFLKEKGRIEQVPALGEFIDPTPVQLTLEELQ